MINQNLDFDNFFIKSAVQILHMFLGHTSTCLHSCKLYFSYKQISILNSIFQAFNIYITVESILFLYLDLDKLS